jgi:hypothetical protein
MTTLETQKTNESLGRTATMQEAEFTFRASETKKIFIAGRSNDWNMKSTPVKKNKDGTWPFTDGRNAAVYTTRDIIEKGKPILLVTHDQDDGAWQFHAMETVPTSEARVVALDEIIFRDPSIVELADLPLGWSAIRDSITAQWKQQPISSGA